MQTHASPIVVGVTGRGENSDALRFAANEAELRGCGVALIHAVLPGLPHSPIEVLSTDEPWREVGEKIVEDVRAEFVELTDGTLPVTTHVIRGRPGVVLGELSADAELVVLQHRDLSRLHRYVTGSTVASAAAHCSCPVVSVPHPWSPHGSQVIGVGVHEDGGPATVLEVAFSEAALRGFSIRVVHAWRVASAYGDMFVQDVAWTGQMDAVIGKALDEVRGHHPEIPVQVEVRHEYAADALVELSELAEFLVIGRHGHLPVTPHHVGSLARAVAFHAKCPVWIVPA